MSHYLYKKLLTSAFFLILLSSNITVFAAGDGPTAGTLGSAIPANDKAGATDLFILSCPAGTQSARANLNEGNNAAVQLSVVITDNHGKAVTASAVNGGLSPQARLDGGAGAYLVSVHKDNLGLEGYTFTIDCYSFFGARLAGNQATLVQNQ